MDRTRPDAIQADTQRRIGNTIRYGRIEEIDYATSRARVRMGATLTTWVPWTTGRAGRRRP